MLTLVYAINSINNGILLHQKKIKLTKFNTLTLNILVILQQLNIIESFLIDVTNTYCTIYFYDTMPFFQKLICISKPNKYIYYKFSDLVKLRTIDLYNDYILSVNMPNHTIINIDDAIKFHVGGLMLLKIIK